MKTTLPIVDDLPAGYADMPLVLTQHQVAKLLHITTHRVTWMVRKGDLPGWWMVKEPPPGEANRAIHFRRFDRGPVLAALERLRRAGRKQTARDRLDYAAWRARQEKIGHRSKRRKAA